jgi:hypothetical protein
MKKKLMTLALTAALVAGSTIPAVPASTLNENVDVSYVSAAKGQLESLGLQVMNLGNPFSRTGEPVQMPDIKGNPNAEIVLNSIEHIDILLDMVCELFSMGFPAVHVSCDVLDAIEASGLMEDFVSRNGDRALAQSGGEELQEEGVQFVSEIRNLNHVLRPREAREITFHWLNRTHIFFYRNVFSTNGGLSFITTPRFGNFGQTPDFITSSHLVTSPNGSVIVNQAVDGTENLGVMNLSFNNSTHATGQYWYEDRPGW